MKNNILITVVLTAYCTLSSCINRVPSTAINDNDCPNILSKNISASIIDESEYIDKQWDSTGMRFLTDNIDDDFWPEMVVDTTIKDFHIRYKILYNNQLVRGYDTLFPNRSVFMNIQYKKRLILYKEYRVSDFPEIIPVEESQKYGLGGTFLVSASDSTVSFHLGYYIPDTDLGYPIMLTITKEGKVLTSLIDEGELDED
jgi:lipoprotein